jgi:hypothetical protein
MEKIASDEGGSARLKAIDVMQASSYRKNQGKTMVGPY